MQEKILLEAAHVYSSRSDDEKQQDFCGYVDTMLKEAPDLLQGSSPEVVAKAREIRPPRSCISCLLIGNHSAGKSSFINWYVGEKVQSTSVAMETCGITVIRHGSKRAAWRGRQTASAFPHLDKLAKMPGVVEHLSSEFSPSTEKEFRLLELIDTPGLVDGNVRYPFDVEAAIEELAVHSEVILIFLDPMGKALVARCMRMAQKLAPKHFARMRFIVGKFDTVRDQQDRVNVISQISQQIQNHIQTNTQLFPIYLPDKVKDEPLDIPNQLQAVCDIMSAAIDNRVQDVLVTLESDCRTIVELAKVMLRATAVRRRQNTAVNVLRVLLGVLVFGALGLLVYWTLLNVTELDPMMVCDDQHARSIEWFSPTGELLAREHHEPVTTWQCAAATGLGGIPALVVVLLLTGGLLYVWLFKATKLSQLSFRQTRKLQRMCQEVEKVRSGKLKQMKHVLTRAALDDA